MLACLFCCLLMLKDPVSGSAPTPATPVEVVPLVNQVYESLKSYGLDLKDNFVLEGVGYAIYGWKDGTVEFYVNDVLFFGGTVDFGYFPLDRVTFLAADDSGNQLSGFIELGLETGDFYITVTSDEGESYRYFLVSLGSGLPARLAKECLCSDRGGYTSRCTQSECENGSKCGEVQHGEQLGSCGYYETSADGSISLLILAGLFWTFQRWTKRRISNAC